MVREASRLLLTSNARYFMPLNRMPELHQNDVGSLLLLEHSK